MVLFTLKIRNLPRAFREKDPGRANHKCSHYIKSSLILEFCTIRCSSLRPLRQRDRCMTWSAKAFMLKLVGAVKCIEINAHKIRGTLISRPYLLDTIWLVRNCWDRVLDLYTVRKWAPTQNCSSRTIPNLLRIAKDWRWNLSQFPTSRLQQPSIIRWDVIYGVPLIRCSVMVALSAWTTYVCVVSGDSVLQRRRYVRMRRNQFKQKRGCNKQHQNTLLTLFDGPLPMPIHRERRIFCCLALSVFLACSWAKLPFSCRRAGTFAPRPLPFVCTKNISRLTTCR